VDAPARDGLACDVMEPVRPQVDAYLLDWSTRQPLKREWFFEERDGNCRLMGSFALRLSETMPLWRRAVAPVAEWVARAFWSTIRRPDALFATRLTQNNKRAANGRPAQPPHTKSLTQENVCIDCGSPIDRSHRWCAGCALRNSTEALIKGATTGRVVAQSATARARRIHTKRQHDLDRSNWAQSDQPSWLTPELYRTCIQPRLADATLSEIASAIRVSIPYASDIRKGRRRPHPRHWLKLCGLVGVRE
jgi:hypothetical protein